MSSRKPKEFDDHPSEFPEFITYRAFCTHVVDGDTFDVFIDLGLNKYAYETIRLMGVDTPEIFRPKTVEEKRRGMIAKNFVIDKILNKQIKIETHKDKTSFGRYVGNVYYMEDDVWLCLAEELIKWGLEKQ